VLRKLILLLAWHFGRQKNQDRHWQVNHKFVQKMCPDACWAAVRCDDMAVFWRQSLTFITPFRKNDELHLESSKKNSYIIFVFAIRQAAFTCTHTIEPQWKRTLWTRYQIVLEPWSVILYLIQNHLIMHSYEGAAMLTLFSKPAAGDGKKDQKGQSKLRVSNDMTNDMYAFQDHNCNSRHIFTSHVFSKPSACAVACFSSNDPHCLDWNCLELK